jgi:uncharacterized membrane protein
MDAHTDAMNTLLLYTHIAAGSLGLASMLIPMVAPKGGALHRRAGWVFVVSMGTVAVTALFLCTIRLMVDPTAEGRMSAIFLGFISILTGTAVSAGVRVLRTRNRTTAHLHWWDVGLAAVLLASGVGLFGYGLSVAQPLLIAFSVIGVVNGSSALRYWLRPPQTKMHWWFEHMGHMIGASIAATTAFLVQIANNSGGQTLLVWLAPTLIGVPGLALWRAYYRRRFGRPAPSSSSHAVDDGGRRRAIA